jgi:protein phosphatase 2C family protein 2/3
MQGKLPLLIKGKVALEVSKKFYLRPSQIVDLVVASAGETDQGLVRDYNEDKFVIIQQGNLFFFGVYDGHGGGRCSEFLKQSLHELVLNDPDLQNDAKNVILRSFVHAENLFIEDAKRNNFDRSGSCALICLIIKDKCFVANLGDSRAVLSSNKGMKVFPLSKDHKPADESEMARIVQAGGYVYQNSNFNAVPAIVGPHRVFPGRLSVSRTIGDIQAKLVQYGGNSNVIIPTPDVKNFRITAEHDFIVLASDGIFDRIDNQKVVDCVWEAFRENFRMSVQSRCQIAAKKVIQLAFERKSTDNVTVIIVAFANVIE